MKPEDEARYDSLCQQLDAHIKAGKWHEFAMDVAKYVHDFLLLNDIEGAKRILRSMNEYWNGAIEGFLMERQESPSKALARVRSDFQKSWRQYAVADEEAFFQIGRDVGAADVLLKEMIDLKQAQNPLRKETTGERPKRWWEFWK